MKCFEGVHPIILFFYFMCVLLFTMFTMNPILLGISFFSGVVFCGMLLGWKALLKSLAYSLPMMLMIALTNPLFVHKGETILFFLNDNPVTLESILYGGSVSVMLTSVFYWFKCYDAVMTSDKFIYLFGRVIPKLSLLLSMILSFIPKFKQHFKEVYEAQKAIGLYASKSFVDKIFGHMRVLSILITWSLENSVETADSMRARGYGLKGRTSYSIFHWTSKDTLLAIVTGMLSIGVGVCFCIGLGDFAYYPTLNRFSFSVAFCGLYAGLFLLMFMTTVLEIKENLVWRYLKSRI